MWSISVSQREYLILQNQINNILPKKTDSLLPHLQKRPKSRLWGPMPNMSDSLCWGMQDHPPTSSMCKCRQICKWCTNLLSKYARNASNGCMSQMTRISFGQINKDSPGVRTTRHLRTLHIKALRFYLPHTWQNTHAIQVEVFLNR